MSSIRYNIVESLAYVHTRYMPKDSLTTKSEGLTKSRLANVHATFALSHLLFGLTWHLSLAKC